MKKWCIVASMLGLIVLLVLKFYFKNFWDEHGVDVNEIQSIHVEHFDWELGLYQGDQKNIYQVDPEKIRDFTNKFRFTRPELMKARAVYRYSIILSEGSEITLFGGREWISATEGWKYKVYFSQIEPDYFQKK